jgi:hypothetical protein
MPVYESSRSEERPMGQGLNASVNDRGRVEELTIVADFGEPENGCDGIARHDSGLIEFGLTRALSRGAHPSAAPTAPARCWAALSAASPATALRRAPSRPAAPV